MPTVHAVVVLQEPRGVGHALMLAPELGGHRGGQAGIQGAFPGVVGDGLGTDVDFNLAVGRDDAAVDRAEKGRTVLGLDSGLGVDSQLNARDVRAGFEDLGHAEFAVVGQYVEREALDQRFTVVIAVLLPDAEGEVDAAIDGGARDHLEGGEVSLSLRVGQAGNGDVGELRHRYQKGVGRDQVGGLVPKGEAERVESVERELVEIGLPEGGVEVPRAVHGVVVREDADAALAQEGRLAGGWKEVAPVQRRRGQVDAAGRFAKRVGETAIIRSADSVAFRQQRRGPGTRVHPRAALPTYAKKNPVPP